MKTKEEQYIDVLQAAQREWAVVEYRCRYDSNWKKAGSPIWNFGLGHYRVVIPRPGKTHITGADWDGQPVIWIRRPGHVDRPVTGVSPGSFIFLSRPGEEETRCFDGVPRSWEYSFDRKTGHSFMKESAADFEVIATTEDEP